MANGREAGADAGVARGAQSWAAPRAAHKRGSGQTAGVATLGRWRNETAFTGSGLRKSSGRVQKREQLINDARNEVEIRADAHARPGPD